METHLKTVFFRDEKAEPTGMYSRACFQMRFQSFSIVDILIFWIPASAGMTKVSHHTYSESQTTAYDEPIQKYPSQEEHLQHPNVNQVAAGSYESDHNALVP